MTTSTNNDKYLVFRLSNDFGGGLDHLLAELKGAIREAVCWGRILVIDKYHLSAVHNLGYRLENLDIKRYINLDKTQVYKIEGGRNIHSIHSSFRYIYAEDFNRDDYPAKQILFAQGNIEPITKEQDGQYKVIIRKTNGYFYHKLYSNILVSFYPSDEVNRLTDIALNAMGTSLAAVKKRELIYQGVDFSVNNDIFMQKMSKNPLYYAAINLRTGIHRDKFYSRVLKYWTNPHKPKMSVDLIRSRVSKGQTLYIMSDASTSYYFGYLSKNFIVYQYYDCPELKALVSGDNAQQVDNAMLYSVEENIFQYAYIKALFPGPYPKSLFILSPIGVPWWYKFRQLYNRLSTAKTFI